MCGGGGGGRGPYYFFRKPITTCDVLVLEWGGYPVLPSDPPMS